MNLCKELIPSPLCEEFVRVYIPSSDESINNMGNKSLKTFILERNYREIIEKAFPNTELLRRKLKRLEKFKEVPIEEIEDIPKNEEIKGIP